MKMLIMPNAKLTRFTPEVITREENRNNGAFPISLFNRNKIGAVQYTFSNVIEQIPNNGNVIIQTSNSDYYMSGGDARMNYTRLDKMRQKL